MLYGPAFLQENDHFGSSLHLDGDFDGDGHADLLIGGTAPGVKADDDTSLTRAFLFLGTANTPALIVEGNGTRDQLGTRSAFLPDMNGDGRDEIVIVAPNWPDQYSRIGIIYLYLGRSGLSAANPLILTGADADVCITGGVLYGGRFGDALDTGFIDADGVADLLIGSPGSDLTDGNSYAGAVRIFFGGAGTALGAAIAQAISDPSSTPVDILITEADVTVFGVTDSDRFGHSVAILGNINGVVGAELAVGAPQVRMDSGAARCPTGAGYVKMLDDTGTTLGTLSGSQPPIIYTPPHGPPVTVSDGEGFGFSVGGGVDVGGGGPNGDLPDEINDIIVGAILYDRDFNAAAQTASLLKNAGAVHVFSGADFTRLLHPPGNSAEPSIVGQGKDDSMGSAVVGIPDVVGANNQLDGFPDLLVGAFIYNEDIASGDIVCPPLGESGSKAGASYVVNGKTGALRYRFIGERFKDSLGYAVAAGDLDEDGKLDVFSGGLRWSAPTTGAATESGRAYRFEILIP